MEDVPGQLTQSRRRNLEMADLSTKGEPEALAAILQLTPLFPETQPVKRFQCLAINQVRRV